MKNYDNKKLLIGIDIGKNENYISFSKVNQKAELRKRLKLANNVYSFYELLEIIEIMIIDENVKKEYILIGIESTGHYWRNIYNFFDKRGYDMVMVKNKNVKLKREAKYGRKKKNDSIDSHCIGLVIKDDDFFEINKSDMNLQSIRSLTRLKDSMITERGKKKNKLNKCLDVNNPVYFNIFTDLNSKTGVAIIKHFPSPRDIIGKSMIEILGVIRSEKKNKTLDLKLLNEYIISCNEIYEDIIPLSDGERFEIDYYINELEKIENDIAEIDRSLVKATPEVIPAYENIIKIKGIGKESIITLLAEIGNIKRFRNARALQSFLGLGISGESSGESSKENNITKEGNRIARKTLYDIAMKLVTHNDVWRTIYCYYKSYNRENPNRDKEMLIAVACKFLRVVYGMMHNNNEFNEEELLKDYDFSLCNREKFTSEFRGDKNKKKISEEEIDRLFLGKGKQNRTTFN